MAVIQDHKSYKVLHPKTGEEEVWTGQRIRIYVNTYGGEVLFPEKKKKQPAKDPEATADKPKKDE